MQKKMNNRKRILQIFSILFMLGGIIRLFASKAIFELCLMTNLWVNHIYFVYIYRILGAFVILVGLMLFAISRNLKIYYNLLYVLTIGFILIGFVMMITGFLLKLHLVFYVFDFVFCFALAYFFDNITVHYKQKDI